MKQKSQKPGQPVDRRSGQQPPSPPAKQSAAFANFGTPDYTFLMIVILLTCVGLVMVFSSSGVFSLNTQSDALYYLKQEAKWVAMSLFAMGFMMVFSYKRFRKLALWGLGLAVAMLAAVLVLPESLAPTVNGSNRWLQIPGLRIHVGEFAKLTMIVFFAVFLSSKQRDIRQLPNLLTIVGIYGGIGVLLLMEPDFGMTFVIGLILVAMLCIAGVNSGLLLGGIAAGVVGGWFIAIAEPYRYKRLMAFRDPFADADGVGYQVAQSLIAIGNGGWFGRGLGKSLQKLMFLPEQHTDFIFSIIAEELGILGVMLVVGLFIALTVQGFKIAMKCEDPLGKYLVFGITFMISAQALFNMGVATAMLPVKGLTLPFVSFGGASLLLTYAAVGIVLNVSANSNRERMKKNEMSPSGGGGNGRSHIPGNSPRPSRNG